MRDKTITCLLAMMLWSSFSQMDRNSLHPSSHWSLIAPANATSSVRVDQAQGYRYIDSDGMPDHATGRFPNSGNPNRISAQSYEFRMPLYPQESPTSTPLRGASFGIAVNGIPFDPGTAEWWRNDPQAGWNIEALTGGISLGLDGSNAHVQPTGAYHYHALPMGIVDQLDYFSGPFLVGYAADGFPIYTPYGYRNPDDPSSGIIQLKSSYRTKSGKRPGGPGGDYDGTYSQDFEFVAGLGDLDHCNGRSGVTPDYPEGTYYYVITEQFPYIPRCWTGDPDPSFRKPRGMFRPNNNRNDNRQQSGGQGILRKGPPQEAIAACQGLSSGAACGFISPRGDRLKGQCFSPPGARIQACRPEGHRPRNQPN